MSNAYVTRKGWQRLLTAVGAVAVAAALSMTGANEAKAQEGCEPFFDDNGGLNVVYPDIMGIPANCRKNGSSFFDQSWLNAGAGLGNGSYNNNTSVLNGDHPEGLEINLQVANAWFGFVNDAGNANFLFGPGLAVHVSALNSSFGVANGSGSANVLFGASRQDGNLGDCTVDEGLDRITDIHEIDGEDIGFIKNYAGDCPHAVKIAVGNTDFGVLNRGLNGNIVGQGSSFVLEAENFSKGFANLSKNGNIVDNCRDVEYGTDGKTYTQLECDEDGSAKVIAINNTAFGNENGTGNGNALGGLGDGLGDQAYSGNTEVVIKDTRMFGNKNVFGNGNAFGNGGDAYVHVENSFVNGNDSLSYNANGDNGYFEATNMRVMGDESASYNGNGNAENPDGYVVLNNDTVIGNRSLSNNAQGTYENDIILGDDTASFNQDGFSDNVMVGHRSGTNAGTNVTNNVSTGHDSANFYAANATENLNYGNRSGNFVNGNGNLSFGNDTGNNIGSSNNQAMGNMTGNNVSGDRNLAHGYNTGNNVTGFDNISVGTGAGNGVTASKTVSIGNQALAAGDSGVAIGDMAYAAGPMDTALGAGAAVTADHSTALGAGAKATLHNQFVMGTKADTYKAPGITSKLSKQRQHGPLEVVTSDRHGDLATDGGAIFSSLDNLTRRTDNLAARSGENRAGVALALAAVNPDLTRDERFGIAASWGIFEGSNAFGMGLEGVLGHDMITRGDRVAITGGWGIGFVDGDGDDVYGGRLGGQWTWGAAPQ